MFCKKDLGHPFHSLPNNKLNRSRRIRSLSHEKMKEKKTATQLNQISVRPQSPLARSWWRSEDSESNSLLPQGEFGFILILFRWEGEYRPQCRFWLVWLSMRSRLGFPFGFEADADFEPFLIETPESWFLVEIRNSMYFWSVLVRFSRLCWRWNTFGVLEGRWLGLSQLIGCFWIQFYYLSLSPWDLYICLFNLDSCFVFFLRSWMF